MTDAVALLQDLIRCKSVTPDEGGALAYLEKLLTAHGFTCHRLKFSEHGTPDVDNLYARFGTGSPHFCFAGHTDVVPPGDASAWKDDPFGGVVRDGYIYGRGACDMKGGVSAFVAAAIRHVKTAPQGSVSLLLTGDEEGPAINGTKKVLEWLAARNEKIDFCLVGEPTSRQTLGDMAKIGRRGTLTGKLAVAGVQGHVAYPHLADNPVPKLLKLLSALDALELDHGSAHFEPSNLEIVNIDIGNATENLIPPAARATFNVRFNDQYTGDSLEKKLRAALDNCRIPYHLDVRVGGESFYTPPGVHSGMVQASVSKMTGRTPELSTTGGTSDARFIRQYCPVIEFGIVGATAHKTDECVKVDDVRLLADIYLDMLQSFHAQ